MNERIDALLEEAWALRSHDVPRANALATEAYELAREHGYTLGQARAARTQAMTVADRGQLKDILVKSEEALRLFDEVGEPAGRAAARDFLSSIHEFTGDLAGALELALDALAIAREIDDPIRQGYALSSVGGILAASGEVEPGIERLREALQLFQTAEDINGVGSICSRLCGILREAGRSDEALRYAEMTRDAAEQTGNEFLTMSSLTVMAGVEEDRGELDEAERLYRAALTSLSSETSRDVIGVQTQVALARLLMKRERLEEAEGELEDVLRRVDDNVSIMIMASALEALAEVSERQQRLPSAIANLRAAQALRDRIAQNEASQKMAQIEARAAVDAAKKDAEIHRLRFVELHGMQSKLVEAEKMALLGKLAAGAAHELHTPLGALNSNAEVIATALERLVATVRLDSEAGEHATKLASVLASSAEANSDALARIASIAETLARFADLDQAERRRFDVRRGLDGALSLVGPTIAATIEVVRRFGEVPNINGWPRELNHAFMTVLRNAVDAIEDDGVITVETTATDEHVLVRIHDTGRGMTAEQTARLFDVAWSDKGTRTRMRLGLSAAFATMQKHGGALEVESAVGEGTMVTFRFPR